MPIRINGLGSSGLDIDTLVSQMVKAKQIPIDQMIQKKTYLEWKRDAYRSMNTEISSFMNEAFKLTLQSTFMAKKASMSASDAEKVLVSPTASAFTGNFTLKVTQLAKAATLTSSSALGVSANPSQALATADATLKITGETGSQSISILNGDNINQIVSKINDQSSLTGVKAVYDRISDKLTLVSTTTGSTAKVQIQETTATATNILNNKLFIAPAATPTDTGAIMGQDAIVDLNGTGNVTVKSNSFTMNDINFTLLQDPAGTPYTVSGSINTDVDAIVSSIKGTFDKYNALIDKINSKVAEPKYRDYLPLTDTQKKEMKDADITLWNEKAQSGLLSNDSILTTGLVMMRNDLSDPVTGIPAGRYASLSDIGITTAPGGNSQAYKENGKIYIDESKLRTALTNNPDQVAALFTKDGARDANGNLIAKSDAGIGIRLYETLKKNMVAELTQKTQIVPTRSSMNIQIDDYASRIIQKQAGLNDYEQQLYSQFATLQTALDKMNAQGSYLYSLFQK